MIYNMATILSKLLMPAHNREPYGQGWIFVFKIDNADDLKQLKDAAAYKQQIS